MDHFLASLQAQSYFYHRIDLPINNIMKTTFKCVSHKNKKKQTTLDSKCK